MKWNPPETAPKNRAFLITTAGPGMDICFWDKHAKCFRDYYHKQQIRQAWPNMVAWAEMPEPAHVCNTIEESRKANGFGKLKGTRKSKANA